MQIVVVNRHEYKGKDAVYVGRPSVLGNPYKLRGESSRTAVIEKYRQWLRNQWKQGGPAKWMLLWLVRSYREDGQLVLVCSCVPKACHADVIRDAVLAICAKQGG